MTKPQPGTWNSDASHFRKPARRDFLYAGWLGGLGLSMGNLFKLQAASEADAPAKTIEPKAKSVIHIYLQGGFAHMDSFDPKPDAPLEYRGIIRKSTMLVANTACSPDIDQVRLWFIQVLAVSFRTNWVLEVRCLRMWLCQRPEVSFWEVVI
jgi:hypothetical protein